MDEKIFYFFDQHMDALPLYEKLEQRISNEIENVQIIQHPNDKTKYGQRGTENG